MCVFVALYKRRRTEVKEESFKKQEGSEKNDGRRESNRDVKIEPTEGGKRERRTILSKILKKKYKKNI